MHYDIVMLFVAVASTVLCSVATSPLSNSISTLINSQIITLNKLEQEQYNYEIVIPRARQTFSSVPDWKARLRDDIERKKRSSDINTDRTNLSYEIRAFNRTFDLTLSEDEAFLAPTFVTQHYDYNRTWLIKDVEHCFYKGHVNDQPSSSVSISLCHGLLGTFVYNDTEYFIEPKHRENETEWNFEHLFYTHKDFLVSSTDNDQTVRCPVTGEPYFEKHKSYPQYHRTAKQRQQRTKLSSLSSSSSYSLSALSPSQNKRRAKRQLDFDPTAKHVEVLVAYDHSIKEFHSDADIKSYILTLFSYVSHLYSDASIGNNIKVWLVKLVDLGKDITEYIKSSDDAADILGRFCRWQHDYNTPGSYDAAVLLTRTPLCNKRAKNVTDSKCDTLGLTELGTMCNLTSNCAVVRDNGFATAFTIAHEIAHLFGIRHDNDKACLEHTTEQNIMATSLTFNHNHYKWSNCSRHYFTQYLESDRYRCLNNIPDYKSALFKSLNDEQKARELPGRFSDLDDQCRRAFGVNFEYCKDLSHGPKCTRLYCREIDSTLSSCITNHAHWSDGTLCSEPRSEIKRCFRGQCRSTHDLQVINGNWGDWSPWSPCTRTCGSAVQKSQRFCDNPKPENGGQYCSGPSTRIRSCENNPPCKDPVDMFRQRQCSVYNNRTIDPLLPIGVRFEPKYNVLPSERCKLICKVSDDRLERSFVLSDRVEDGTPCGREEETRDICINGVCMPIGCDHKYGSNATEDVCGVCNGQNRTCKLVNGQHFVNEFGITHILDIPVNTTRVSVTQLSSGNDRYYLAVKHANGTYVLNGMHSLQLYNVKIRIGGSTLSYTGSDSGNETVLITGRLKVPLEIQVISIYQAGAPGTQVLWEYYTPLDEDDLARQYGDESSDYHCDRPCQGFKQVKKCFIHGKPYDPIYCSTYNIPFTHEKQPCNDDCVLSWSTPHQQACSSRCGNGYKRVIYECTKYNTIDGIRERMDETMCRKYVGEKPKDVVECVGDCTGTGWIHGSWGECQHENGNCIRKRVAECRNASNLVVPSYYCISDFIFNTERCADMSCDQARWNYTSWSECDCATKRRRRTVSCARNGKLVNDHECAQEPKPDETISCYDECVSPRWEPQPWQPCTATCSSHTGFRHRHVLCYHHGSVVRDDYCQRQQKPTEHEWCSTNVSCSAWSVGDWTACSVTCGTGFQRRTVQCQQDGRPMDRSKCTQPMPVEQQTCHAVNNALCSSVRWSTGPWDDCSATCGSGIQQRSVYCDDPSRPWIRIPDSECLNLLGEQSKPSYRQNCSITECPRWEVSPWSKCSGQCGVSERRRRIFCSHNGRELEDNYCLQMNGEKPAMIEKCRPDEYCPSWTTGMWSECSGPMCSSGMQYRQVVCRQGSETLASNNCDETLRPVELQTCQTWNSTVCKNVRPAAVAESGSTFMWDVKQFGECSVTCGVGRRLRQVHCVNSLTKAPHDDTYCSNLPRKPIEYETCSLNACPEWAVEPWSPCPVTCGTGMQHRLVMCKNREELVSPEKCNGLNRPSTTMQCHLMTCPSITSKTFAQSPGSATWIPSDWAQCDLQTCTQTRTVRCIDSMNGRLIPLRECTQNQVQPSLTRICPISACLEWRVAHWNGCSVKCGRGIELGFGLSCYTRQIPIRKLNASECELAEPHLPKPVTRRVCRRSCVEWRTSDWSECDAPCGTGKRIRQVTCHRKFNGKQVDDRWCLQRQRNLTRPDSEEICINRPCFQWIQTQTWTECSAKCNGGYEENLLQCATKDDSMEKIVDDRFCNDIVRPNIRRPCNIQPCPTKPLTIGRFRRRRRWDVGPWSSCNTPCGVGEQYRLVRCIAIHRNRVLDDRFCRHLTEPNRVQQCFPMACSPMWATSTWSSCSAVCGSGTEYRGISCHEVNNNGYLMKNNYSNNCDPYRAPTTRISCNMGDCESTYLWHVEPWSSCSSDCNRGEQTRQVYCKNRQTSLPIDDRFCIPHKPVNRIDCYGFFFINDQSSKR